MLVIGPSSTMGAVMPPSRRPPTKVVVFQWPWGAPARSRSPRGALPRVVAILVVAPVWLLRADLRFVDEHQPLGVEVGLGVEPSLTRGQDVRPILLGGVRGFFQL